MYKLKKEGSKVDASFGFSKTIELKIKYPVESTYHQQRGIKYDTIILSREMYELLCRRFGSYNFGWYFAYPDLLIKYYDHKQQEWKMDYLLDLIKGGIK